MKKKGKQMRATILTAITRLAITPAMAFAVSAAVPMGVGTGLWACGAVKSARAEAAAKVEADGYADYEAAFEREAVPYLAAQHEQMGETESDWKKMEDVN